jgi:serine phosphatase RsbU (regulator of sigma subunit)
MAAADDDLVRLLQAAALISPGAEASLLDEVCRVLGADGARLHVADYALRRLQQVDVRGLVGSPVPVAGSLLGWAFTSGDPVTVHPSEPTLVLVPLVDGTERIGLLELEYGNWAGGLPPNLQSVAAVLVLVLIAKGRYSDQWTRARRSWPLSPAAEIQWDLLPPLSCSTESVGIGGILEPAYEIGGDSFDYAVNGHLLQFAIIDAVGHGMDAVLMAAAAINSLRNSRRTEVDLVTAFTAAGDLIERQFGRSRFVTAQIASLDVTTGILTWINGGHPLPLLVRNGRYAGELPCVASRPLGLGGPIKEVATTRLQRGDRILFSTDGVVEARGADGLRFGQDRLVDFLVRAALEGVPVADTARRLSTHILDHVDAHLHDDATLLLIEYRGQEPDLTVS